MSSLYMGCVSYSRQFFRDGVVDAHQMKLAELAARARGRKSSPKQYRKMGWKEACTVIRYGQGAVCDPDRMRVFQPRHHPRRPGQAEGPHHPLGPRHP